MIEDAANSNRISVLWHNNQLRDKNFKFRKCKKINFLKFNKIILGKILGKMTFNWVLFC